MSLTQNPNDLVVMSVNAIGEKTGIHASSFVRYAQSLGFRGSKNLQAVFQRRLTTAAPGFDARVRALAEAVGAREDRSDLGFLRDLVVRDVTALQEISANTSARQIAAAAKRMDRADTPCRFGQLRSAPVAEVMRSLLTMLGKRMVLLDASGGLATQMAKVIQPRDLLFAISFRFYPTEGVNVVDEVASRGVPVVAMSDSTLSPLATSAQVLFAIPEHEYTFSRNRAAPRCLAQGLSVAAAKEPRQPADSGGDRPLTPLYTPMRCLARWAS